MEIPSWVIDEMEEKIKELEDKLAIAIEALESISKNGCCDTCQEAKLVSLKALAKIRGEG